MLNRELNRQLQSLEQLFQRTAAASDSDIELQAHWAKYLCVLSAGFLENALSELFAEFVKSAASEHVANYAVRTLSRISNPKAEKFFQTARAFKHSWGDDLQHFMDENGRKEAINSIMDQRHKIAHGKNSDISIVRLRGYLDRAVEVLNFIEQQLLR